MTEYIEKEAARPDEFCVGVSCQECPFLKDHLYGGCRVDDFIMALQPADVRPVVRGRWELDKDGWYCTACKSYSPFDCDPKEKGIPFCPICGADLRR